MNILIIGSGGREHALAWKFRQSKQVNQIYVIPGNDGMKDVAIRAQIDISNNDQILAFAIEMNIDLTVVGTEEALANGLVNLFKRHSLNIFGPTKEAALIETSKEYAKDLMTKYHIPTAKYQTFTNYEKAVEYIKTEGAPIVIKSDGLAQGKGVVVAMDKSSALDGLKMMMIDKKVEKVVIEEYLVGEEFSLMALVHGERVIPLEIAQDHKRAFDGDHGPNTGGMGAYSPVNQITKASIQEAMDQIMIPCAKALVEENKSFTGILYGGLMQTSGGVKVIEFNARFGDPETEVILPKLKNDLVEVITHLLEEKEIHLEWDLNAYVGVVLASKGYPNAYQLGFEINNLNHLKDVLIFHMGTKITLDRVYTNGGRVLIVVGKGSNIKEAQGLVYDAIHSLDCEALFYRTDIGNKAIDI